MKKPLDILISEPQLFLQTLAVNTREPLSTAQIVDCDRDFEQNVVRGMEPVAEPSYMRTQTSRTWAG
jgi:hypothetical protein